MLYKVVYKNKLSLQEKIKKTETYYKFLSQTE